MTELCLECKNNYGAGDCTDKPEEKQECNHDFGEISFVGHKLLNRGILNFVCKKCGEPEQEKKSEHQLAIDKVVEALEYALSFKENSQWVNCFKSFIYAIKYMQKEIK